MSGVEERTGAHAIDYRNTGSIARGSLAVRTE